MPEFGPPADVPPTREITHVRGFGGFLNISRVSQESVGSTQRDRVNLEVSQWTIRHRFRAVELPISGGFGAITRRRVATDFQFAADLPFNVLPLGLPRGTVPTGAALKTLAFLEDLFRGFNREQYMVGVLFAIGDPFQYDVLFPAADQRGRNSYYFCDSVHLDELVIVTSTEPADVVRLQANGSGSAPLRRYSGPLWEGAGGFEFGRVEQGHN